ncbi:MAG: MFS transporter [Dehalococcoidia bacterium]|nr:MFS transporter [Dehalococcoidia bacterium]
MAVDPDLEAGARDAGAADRSYNLAARVFRGVPAPAPPPADERYNLARQVYGTRHFRGERHPALSAGDSAVATSLLALPSAAAPAPREAAPQARPRGRAGTFSALRNAQFRSLFLGNVMQFGAMQMQLLVRGALVYQLTGSFTALGLVSLANAVPGLLFSLVGGVVADRAPKKTVIQAAQLFNLVNAAVLAVLAGTGQLSFAHLLVSAVAQGGVNAIMQPSRQSIIPDLVGREGLMNAVALNTSGQNLMQLIGPGLGGALLALLSPAWVFWVMAALYLLAVTFTIRLPKHPVFAYTAMEAAAGRSRARSSGWRDLVEGMRYIAHDRTIRMLIAVNFLIVLVSMPYTMMLPGFVHEVLGRGPDTQGLLMSVSGVGALVGSLAVASMSGRNRGRLLLAFAFLVGASLVAFAASTNYLITLPIMLLVGAGSAGRMSLGQILIQSYSADEYRGRVMAVWFMQFSLVQFGTFGVGILSELVGPQLAIGGMAAGLVVAIAMITVAWPSFRRLQ